jgi:putative salt-induced outer membrane protein
LRVIALDETMSKIPIHRLLALTLVTAAAAFTGAEARADWTGKGEAGLVIANGNTDTKNANAKLDLATTAGSWKHAFGLAAVYAATDDLTTGQRWEVFEQSDYNFSPRAFWFGAARYEDDRFSGFEYQATVSTGAGRHFIDNERTKFTGTAGIGYKFFETRDTFDDTGTVLLQRGESDSEGIVRGTLDFRHALTATATLLDQFLVESGADNTFIQNDIGIQVKITDVLALAAAYSVRHNTDPPPEFRKTDTLTTLNLVYEIR